MLRPSVAFTFDLDLINLRTLHDALPEWDIEVVVGATAASLTPHWNPGMADLLVVKARDLAAETLGLCRFLRLCQAATESEEDLFAPLGRKNQRNKAASGYVPLLVLAPWGQKAFAKAVIEAGADECLFLPIQAMHVASLVNLMRRREQPEDACRKLEAQGA